MLRPGDPMGGYRVVRRLGGGAFGDVYEAVNGLGFRVAIKTLKREHMRSGDLRARFVREGLSAVKIRHPNAVQVLDGGEEGGTPYLVMELLDGEDLETLLARTGVLPPARAVDLVLPVMAAVAAAHDEGVIHRDLKPANLFLAKTRDGEVVPKVVDFGISRLKSAPEDGVATRDGALMGSPAYMSPEQTRGAREVGEASDQFSLGVILYECVTGRPAFAACSLPALLIKVSQADFPLPSTVRPTLPADFEALLVRSMALDPARRYPSVRAFGCALLPFASPRVRANLQRVFDPLGASTVARPPPERANVQHPRAVPADQAMTVRLPTPRAATDGSIALPLHRTYPAWWAVGFAMVVLTLGALAWSGQRHPAVLPRTTRLAPRTPPTVLPGSVEAPTATAPPATEARQQQPAVTSGVVMVHPVVSRTVVRARRTVRTRTTVTGVY